MCTEFNKSASGWCKISWWIVNSRECAVLSMPLHFVQGDWYGLAHLGMHEITKPYWERSGFQTFGVNYTSIFHMCSPWPLRSGIYLPPGWVTLHVLFPDRGLKWGCGECNTDPHDLWPIKAAWSSLHARARTHTNTCTKILTLLPQPFGEKKEKKHNLCTYHVSFHAKWFASFYSRLWLNVFGAVAEPDARSLKSQVETGRGGSRRGETALLSGPVSTGHMSPVICH